jgi:hypothetical protein
MVSAFRRFSLSCMLTAAASGTHRSVSTVPCRAQRENQPLPIAVTVPKRAGAPVPHRSAASTSFHVHARHARRHHLFIFGRGDPRGWLGDVALLDAIEARSPRVVAVYGNNDGPALRRRLPEVARAIVAGVRFAVVTGRDPPRLARRGVPRCSAKRTSWCSGTAISRGTPPHQAG